MKASAYKLLNQADKAIILNPDQPLFSLIWLHGLGDTSSGFLDFFVHPQSPLHKGARVKLLHAPIKPVTVNGGQKCPSWYDIKKMNFDGKVEDESKRCSLEEVKESLAIVDKKVQQEVEFWKERGAKGDLYKRIYVGGFSQGCAISLLYGLTCKNLIGGVVGLSGYLFQSFDIPNLGKLPILLNHGCYDAVIPISAARASYKRIIPNDSITYKENDLQHSVDLPQLKELTKWIIEKAGKLE